MSPTSDSEVKNAGLPVSGIRPPSCLTLTPPNELPDNWRLWKQKWNNYSIITELNKKPVSYQVALLLHTIGDETLRACNGFAFKTDEENRTISEIIEAFDSFAIDEINETYERFKFNQRVQRSDETFEAYLTSLRDLIKTCTFCSTCHDSVLRDKIVLGVPQTTRELLLI
jgi:hypothetical protein